MATIIKWGEVNGQRRVEKAVMTEEEYQSMVDAYLGLCLACAATVDTVEPDAEGYHCPSCGQMSVMGTEQALMEGIIEFHEE